MKRTPLRDYGRKRDFSKTAEPKPGMPAETATHRYVIQKHAARRLHYDFRLEMEGVLKSWAVPKGLPFALGEKHLAVHVEDHPLDYAGFEGTIPQGEYGGGTVMVWDAGTYTVSGDDPPAALASGKLHLRLSGKKLQGEWTLVRTRNGDDEKENWLLMKTGDAVKPPSRRADDTSALTGRTMKQIAAAVEPQWETPPADTKTASRAPRGKKPGPAFVAPMKPKLVPSLPSGKGWIYELKFDGYRAIVIKDGPRVAVVSRNEKALDFPDLAAALAKLPCTTATLDGEIVALDPEGRPSFALLQARETGETPTAPLVMYLFDLLNLDGKALLHEPLAERKRLLAELLARQRSELLKFSGDLPGTPGEILERIRSMGLEGIVAKQAASVYEPDRRSDAWVKVKCVNEDAFVIGGYTQPKGGRSHFGALLVGYREGGKLKYAGKVGSGFTEARLAALMREFEPLRIAACPFADLPASGAPTRWGGLPAAEMKRCTWLRPERVCQIKFTEWTRDGRLRQPVFLGLRADMDATQTRREMS